MLRTAVSSLVFGIFSLFAISCTQNAAPVSQDKEPLSEPTADTSSEAPTKSNIDLSTPQLDSEAPTNSDIDLSVPQLDPKPLVWLDKWSGAEPVPQARREAQNLVSVADRLKGNEQFQEAEEAYEKAMQADPTWGYPAYQSACNYELWNQHDRAELQFAKAVELGFDDFPTALTDDELGRVREGPGFTAALLKIRDRYVVSSKTRVGQPLAIRPGNPKPDDGWPVMLLLHGYGDSNLSYLDLAQEWSKLGFLAVAVPGSVPASNGRFMWSMESIEQTHHDLQAIVKSPLLDGVANREKVFLLGFSQGAMHAMLLTAENPDAYAGVVGLSPGGSLAKQLVAPQLNRSGRTARCVFIHGEQESHAPIVGIWSKACKDAGWKFDSKTHPGAHHFPEDWDSIRPVIAAFLIK